MKDTDYYKRIAIWFFVLLVLPFIILVVKG